MPYGTTPIDEFTDEDAPHDGTLTVIAGEPGVQSEALIHEMLASFDSSLYVTPNQDYLTEILKRSAYFTKSNECVTTMDPEKLDGEKFEDQSLVIIDTTHGSNGSNYTPDQIEELLEEAIKSSLPIIFHTDDPIKESHRLSSYTKNVLSLADTVIQLSLNRDNQDAICDIQVTKARQGTPMPETAGVEFKDTLAVNTSREF